MAHIEFLVNNLHDRLDVLQFKDRQYVKLERYITMLTNGAVCNDDDFKRMTLHYGISVPIEHAITLKGVTYIDNVASFTIADDLMERITGCSYRKVICQYSLCEKQALSALLQLEFTVGEAFITTAHLNVDDVEQKRTIYYLQSLGEHECKEMPLVRWLLYGQQRLVREASSTSPDPTLTLVFFQKRFSIRG